MKKYRVAIVDDEYPGRVMVQQLIARHSIFEVVGMAACGREAIELLNRWEPDLVFLDIELQDMNGFDVLARVDRAPIVIFVTAYDQFALKAFQENAIDYLLKPVEEVRFDLTVKKLETIHQGYPGQLITQMQELFATNRPKKEISAIPVYQGDKITLFRLMQLCYVYAENGYVTLVGENGDKKLTERSLVELEEILPANFLRIQKSYIINKDKIKEIHRHFNNRFMITLDDKSQTRLMTGKSYVAIIRESLGLR